MGTTRIYLIRLSILLSLGLSACSEDDNNDIDQLPVVSPTGSLVVEDQQLYY